MDAKMVLAKAMLSATATEDPTGTGGSFTCMVHRDHTTHSSTTDTRHTTPAHGLHCYTTRQQPAIPRKHLAHTSVTAMVTVIVLDSCPVTFTCTV
jgi:hypothetical protein